jgi:hypothetical protein
MNQLANFVKVTGKMTVNTVSVYTAYVNVG